MTHHDVCAICLRIPVTARRLQEDQDDAPGLPYTTDWPCPCGSPLCVHGVEDEDV